jgi:predicted transcriptional regulator
MTRRAFGALEQQVLAVLWAADEPLVARQVQERLADPPAYTTVMTILDRLYHKGQLDRGNRGRAFAYSPLQTETAVATERARTLLDSGADRHAVLQGFVRALSDDDAAEVQRLLRKARDAKVDAPQ